MKDLINASLFNMILARLAPAAAGFAFVAVAVNRFDPATYGQYSLAFTAANLACVLSVTWVSQALLRYVSGNHSMSRQVWPILLGSLALATTVAAVVVFLIRNVAEQASWWSSGQMSAAFVVLTAALALNSTVAAAAASMQRIGLLRNSEIVRSVLLVALALLASVYLRSAAGLALAYATATLAPSLVVGVLFRESRHPRRSADADQLWRTTAQFFRYGWPITIWTGLQACQSFMERGVLGARLDHEVFGRFISVADVVTRGVGLALMPLVLVVHPRIMAGVGAAKRVGLPEQRLIRNSATLLILMAIVLVGFLVLGRKSMALAFPAFGTTEPGLIGLLGLSSALWVVALLIHKPLEVEGNTAGMMMSLAASVAVQFFILNSMTSTLGPWAMPVASAIAASVYMLACAALSARHWRSQ